MVMHPETTSKESNEKSSTHSSSSSSTSSLDLAIEDIEGPSKSGTNITSSPKLKLDSQSAPTHVSITGNSSRSKELDNGSPVPSSSSQETHESLAYDLPSTQSPPLQVMDRSEGYDPLRIPSTVFERKASSPLEWSAASNDSLFSLHLGNNSSSRDHVFMLGGEVLKSGEIPMSGEFLKFSPSVTVEEIEGKSLEWEKGEEIGESDDGIKVSTIDNTEDQSNERGPPTKGMQCSSVSSRSNDSARSFAFPILTEGPEGSSPKAEVQKNPNQQLFDKMASTSPACCCFTCSSCHHYCCSSRCSYCC
ncbi:uncharacterized protein LOC123214207 isoform X2 [Mangifera indica]|uniref:uncharacterized protein LOC123214207 isoform X2 n=1 Tax=Mangifera indica TaxID=29780 RepID=UPI001CF93102|nr:uncharacterized protein LOC123214207 isoform X2 [Mangifera indica]